MNPRYSGARYRSKANPVLVEQAESGRLHAFDYEQACEFYLAIAPHMTHDDMAYLGCVDRYYLFTHLLNRPDGFHPWLYERCREVENDPDGYLDLWAREHYKSSLITFAGSIQEILNNPEITIGVFSHTKDISTKFVAQVKREFETNTLLIHLYPDVLWLRPKTEGKPWSDAEFSVRRASNPKEATMEAWGLVDGQPTSKHFTLLIYDDVVTLKSVTNPEQIRKTSEAFEMSDNLGAGDRRKWMPGTRYHFGDTYGDLIQRGVVKTRIYPATDNGKADGEPVFLTAARWAEIKKSQRTTMAAQMLQNPLSGKERTFHPKWLQPYDIRPTTINVYIMCDPSRGRSANSDRTAMAVIGIDYDGNKFLLDGFCHRMTLSERWDHLKHLHKKWKEQPGVGIIKVGYERYGQQTDDEYFVERMRDEKYHFGIEELNWTRDGTVSKVHRVERLQPDVEYGSFRLPSLVHVAGVGTCKWAYTDDKMVYTKSEELALHRRVKERKQEYLAIGPIKKMNGEGIAYDLTRELMDEMLFFPFAAHDDFVDACSRIYDMEPISASVVEEYDDSNDVIFEDA